MSKKSYEKYFNATLAATVAATGAATVVPNQAEASTTFSDVPTTYNFHSEVMNLAERGIIKGFEDGTFRPGANVTRGQAAKIIAGALGLDTKNVINPGFTDIPTTHQYYGAIAALANAGIISGYEDDTYRPSQPVSRNHMAKIIAGAFNLEASTGYTTQLTDVRSDYAKYINALHEYGVTTGKTATTFDGSSNVTRGQLAAFVVRAENLEAGDVVTITISDVTGKTITGGDATYDVTTALQGVFASSNAKVLNGAVLKAKVVDYEIVSVEALELNAGGEANALATFNANNAVIDGNLVVNADYIEVKNLTVKGNVTLTNKVVNEFGADGLNSEGEFIIDEDATPVAVASLTTFAADVKKGPKVNFKNSKINKVNSKRNNVALSSDSKIGEVVVSANVSAIQIDANVTKVTINVTAKITVTGAGNVDEITLQKATELALQVAGTIGKFVVNDANTKVAVATSVKITTLVVPNGKKAADIITNYTEISKNISKVENTNGTTTSNGGSGGSSGGRDRDDNNSPNSPVVNPNKSIADAIAAIGTNVVLPYGTVATADTVKLAIEKLVDTSKVKVTVEKGQNANTFKILVADINGKGTAKEVVVTVSIAELVLKKLQMSSDALNIGESKDISFRVNYNGPKEDHLVLLKKNGDSYTPYKVNGEEVRLEDKGQSTVSNADLIAGDKIYSAEVEMLSNEPGIVTLVAGIKVGDTWKAVSLTANIISLEPLTTEDAAIVVNTTNTVKTKIQQLKAENKAEEVIKQEIVQTLLENTEEIKTAGASESGNLVWYALKSGALGAVSFTSTESQEEVAVAQPMSLKALSMQNVQNTTGNTTTSVGNQRVLILSAHGQEEGEELANKLRDAEVSFTVNHFKGEDADVKQFKNMFDYGTIVFDTLGAALFKGDFNDEFPYLSELFTDKEEQVVILTGEEVTEDTLIEYNADLKTGRLVTVDGYYAITPAFIAHYGAQNELPNSLVYANSAYSFNNTTLADQFIKNNAAAYVGFEEELQEDVMLDNFDSLLEGTVLKTAVGSQQFAGDGSLAYTKGAEFANGSLEDGENHWISGGHFDSISQLGINQNSEWTTIQPTDGSSMGIISSGVDNTALNGQASWVYQTFTVPENMNVLKFDYNVVSNEPMEFIDSRYDDTFKATIVEGTVKEPVESDFIEGDYENSYDEDYGKGGTYDAPWLKVTEDANETIIAYESINSSYWGDDQSQRVDVVFNDGDRTTYMTGWKTVTFDVSKYKGKTITLKLQTYDLGDSAFPTAVLFDRVHFTQSEVKGLMIDGPKTAIIPQYGEREYQYNALAHDQYNEKVTGEISLRVNDGGYRQPVHAQKGTFTLKAEVDGVTIDANTGILTISSDTVAESVTIVANGALGKVEITVPLKKETYKDYIDEEFPIEEFPIEEPTSIISVHQINADSLEIFYSDEFLNSVEALDLSSVKTVTIANTTTGEFIMTTTEDTILIDSYNYYTTIDFNEDISEYDNITLEYNEGTLTFWREGNTWFLY